MTTFAAIEAETQRLTAAFLAAGATPVACDILQPADVLLDLYGEDIRARAYVTHDPLRGELMLRPDFTVPVVRHHLALGGGTARYTYAGKVFRSQEDDAARPSEYPQVGFEVFGVADHAASDAEVFAVLWKAVDRPIVEARVGDTGLLMAAVAGLSLSAPRRAALMRHIWRPARFQALLDRFSGRAPLPKGRADLLAAVDPFSENPPMIGLRSRAEIEARIVRLRADAAEAPLPEGEGAALRQLMSVESPLPNALQALQTVAKDLPAIATAVGGVAARLQALSDQGIDVGRLSFSTRFGLHSMEYYDGFVFGLVDPRHPDLPPVASGGRFDGITERLGASPAIPAVGGVIRPAVLEAMGAGR
ncbi:MAG: ATP phosphoribosyltransferase regulatory subunit [Rhodobacteraceae bacterium]|nr:ATP phosphoribosyltransferase regulatory subunit [Paracoccaceae bacterium]